MTDKKTVELLETIQSSYQKIPSTFRVDYLSQHLKMCIRDRQSPVPLFAEVETQTGVCQAGAGGGEARRKGGGENRHYHGKTGPACGPLCETPPGRRPDCACRPSGGHAADGRFILPPRHDWGRGHERCFRHFLRFRGQRPVRGRRGLHLSLIHI